METPATDVDAQLLHHLEWLTALSPGFLAVHTGPAHVCRYANPAFHLLTGHRPLIGLGVRDAFPDIADQGFYELLDEVYRTGEPFQAEGMEVHLSPGHGPQPRYVDLTYQPVRNGGGEVVGLVAHGKDVTERVQQERAVQRRVQRHARQQEVVAQLGQRALAGMPLEQLVQHALAELAATVGGEAVTLWELLPDGGALHLRYSWGVQPTDAHAERVSVAAENAVSRALREGRPVVVDNAEVAGNLRPPLAAEGAGGSSVSVLIHGTERPNGVLSVSSAQPRRFDGDDALFVQLVADLLGQALHRQEAAQALQASEAQYRTLIESTPLPIVVLTPTLEVLIWNPAAERIFGYAAAEVVGREYPLRPVGGSLEPQAIMNAALKGAAFSGTHIRRLHRDGRELELQLWLAPMRDGAGRITHTVATFLDVTQQSLLEGQLRQSQKMEAIGRLAGGVAHDFNNILTAVGGYAELLRESIAEDDPLGEGVQEILLGVDRASRLTQQLLSFSRKQIVQPRPLDLNEVLSELRKLLHRVIGEDVALELRTHPGLGLVNADAGQIDQVIMNLVVNARDAMPRGGRIVIATAAETVGDPPATQHAGLVPGEYAVISVADTGTGIPPHLLDRIFEPFFTTKDPSRGTGLGLATVYGIVSQGGGKVVAESREGEGTTMRVYLPLCGARPEPKPPAGTTRPKAASGTVLLVEDEPVVRALTRHLLRRDGYTVLEAGTGEEALALAARHEGPIDLLFTDLIMPGMNGREVAERLHEFRPDLPVLYMSGYTADVISSQGILDEGVYFLQKPFTAAELASRAREAIAGSAQAQPAADPG